MIWNMYSQNMNANNQKRNKKKKRNFIFRGVSILCTIVFLVSGLCGCTAGGNGEENLPKDQKKLQVVTTIFPQYDFVRQIAGDNVSLTMLLKPGEETHSYEPTPQDIIAIQNADLFIYVGGENDEWVEDILESPEMEDVKRLRLVDCVGNILAEEHNEHVHTMDEHVWTSPGNAIDIVEHITEELCSLDPEHGQTYKDNAEAYETQLKELDTAFRDVVENAKNHTLLFGDRFPFRYFAAEYGLDYYAAFSGCASDTEPSAATMAFLINKVKEEHIPVVLKMELSNDNIANAIAEACDVPVKVFYSSHNISAKQFEAGVTYLDLMKENVETLKEALR